MCWRLIFQRTEGYDPVNGNGQDMIISKPTRYGGGLTIWGDYFDLNSLYTTIHKLCDSPPLDDKFGEKLVLALAYDLRHAFQGNRLIRVFGDDKDSKIRCFGVSILWPIYLVQVGLLRWASAFQSTTKLEQSNLFMLEACAQTSLTSYDQKVGESCLKWLTAFSGLPKNYYTDFIENRTVSFMTEAKPGRTRFKRLPEILRSISPNSKDYRNHARHIEKWAGENGADPENVSTTSKEWPVFKM